MHRHLRGTKRGKTEDNDDIESIHGSQSINSDRQVRANARDGRKNHSLKNQMKKYGMGLETATDDNGWIDSSKLSKLCIRILHILVSLNSLSYFALQFLDYAPLQQKKRLRKGTRQSTSPSPPITSHFPPSTRKTRSSSRAKSADGDVITIESSEDEGDDTSNDASEVSTLTAPV
jgi:hypothetical protein